MMMKRTDFIVVATVAAIAAALWLAPFSMRLNADDSNALQSAPDSTEASLNERVKVQTPFSSQEKEILERLKEPLTDGGFVARSSLREMLRQFSETQGVPIYFDEIAIEDEEIALDDDFEISLGDISRESALNLVLRLERMGRLSWIVQDDSLVITSIHAASETACVCLYDVSWLPEINQRQFPDILRAGIMDEEDYGGVIWSASIVNGILIVRADQASQRNVETLLNGLKVATQFRSGAPTANVLTTTIPVISHSMCGGSSAPGGMGGMGAWIDGVTPDGSGNQANN
ncbi:hypothetical protein SH668x_001467 [Planctomicrobium sp. SH668]|uniref:hypothetical protein n=1 Tax=Planctomicrobium sp. SH668 TaxID=3448126 RepID=UPI003F5CA88E